MKNIQMLLAALCLAVVALSACDRAGDAQKREEAINRGDASAQPTARLCQRVHGKWLDDSQRCTMTQASCAAFGATWNDDAGCLVRGAERDACSSADGTAAVDGKCVIGELSASDLDGAWVCHMSKGEWLGDTRRCGVTAPLCAQAAGEWNPDAGCIVPSLAANADQCGSASGLHVVKGHCVLRDLSNAEVDQMGNEDLQRARSALSR